MSKLKSKLAGRARRLDAAILARKNHTEDLPGGEVFFYIDIDLIRPNPYQPRKVFDSHKLADLAQSIREKGVLQPVLVRRDENGQVYMVAGERRLRAAKLAGLQKIPAMVVQGHPAELALIENLQRENLSPLEEAEALARMMTEFNYTHEQLGQLVGRARTTISEILCLNRLTEAIKEECRRADIYPRRLLVEIAKQDSPQTMQALFEKAKKQNLTSDRLRDLTRKRPKKPHRPGFILAEEKAKDLMSHLTKLDFRAIPMENLRLVLTALKELNYLLEKMLKDDFPTYPPAPASSCRPGDQTPRYCLPCE